MHENYAAQGAIRGGLMFANQIRPVEESPTVEENIDRKIRHLQAEIERLEKSKQELAPLLKMRIHDIRQAMEF